MWIAFIFQYLWDTKQLLGKATEMIYRCELLSFFSIFGIQNNCITLSYYQSAVVNCFHFSVSLGYKTTIYTTGRKGIPLWIAFIFQYLWDTKQLVKMLLIHFARCELLSFFSIFGIQNNNWMFINYTVEVVNCFHFSVSLGYKTTYLFALQPSP